MKAIVWVMAMTVLIGFGTAQAQDVPARWASPDNATAKYITFIEKLWSDASCGPPRAAVLGAVAKDFEGTSTSGQRYGRLVALEPGHDRDCQIGHIEAHLFGESLAIAYGSESSMVRNKSGKLQKHCAVWTDTWLKRSGKWQVIAAQDNRVNCGQS